MIRIRLASYTLALSVVTLLTGSIAFAGDGGGINGPSLSGSSIPTALEGGVVWDDISRALTECYATGYGPGSRSLLSRLTEEVFGSDPLRPGSAYVIQSFTLRTHNFSQDILAKVAGGAYPADECTPGGDDCMGKSPFVNFLRLDATAGGMLEVGIQHPLVDNVSRRTDLELREPLVALQWESVREICDSYDALGDCVNRREYFIRPTVRAVFREKGRPAEATLFNKRTGKPTALTVNGDELFDCLQTRLGSPSRR